MRGLTIDALNPAALNVQYAVRGELAIKAEAYRVRLKEGAHDLPFDKVISSNIGNPQQTGLDQPPITFNRQVMYIAIVSGSRCALNLHYAALCGNSELFYFFFYLLFFFLIFLRVGSLWCCATVAVGLLGAGDVLL
jgi:hypothetical protein